MTDRGKLVAKIGAGATALAVPLLPPGLPILLAALVGAAWGWWRSARLQQDGRPA